MNYKKFLITYTLLFYLEVIYHLLVFKTFDFKSIVFLILFTLVNTLFIDIITSILNKKINKWIYILINIFIIALFLAQYINYKFYGNILSVYSVIHGGQVFGFFSAILAVIKENILGCLILFIPIPLLIIFNKKLNFDNFNKKDILIKFVSFISIFIISVLTLNIDKQGIYSSKNIYFNKHVPNTMAQSFGILTTMRLDLQRSITNFKEKIVLVNDTNNEEPNQNEEQIKIEYNKLDIDFANLALLEENNSVKMIHEYMNNSTATLKNEYTGIFKDKNLIVLVAEAFSPLAVNEKLTPTLYKLVNSSFKFTNFYSPIYYVSTSDGEYVSLTSLLPKESVWSFEKSSKNYLPYVYGNAFKNLGYTTYAFHNGRYKYYDRHKSHPNMGYTYMGCFNGLEKLMNCNKWPQSDLEMINATFDMYSNSERFVAYYMTISGHLEYNFMGNNMAYKNKSLVENEPYSTAIKAYIATQIELDKALETLINKLEEKQILDDTVIVLSADHYPYGLTNKEINAVSPMNDEKFDIHKNNLIIYNSALENTVTIDKYAESLDILPTVLNLFGIDYDSRLLMGTDILSSSEGLVILNDRSWITNKGKYNAATKQFTPFNNEEVSTEYIENINSTVYNKFVISKSILETDYYRKIFNEE